MNLVILRGRLQQPPDQRQLRSGDTIVLYELTVPTTAGAPDTCVPVVWFQPPAGAADLEVGAEVVVIGSVRRRYFRSNRRTQSRTEVVADRIIPASRANAAQKAVSDAVAAATGLGGGVVNGVCRTCNGPLRRTTRAGTPGRHCAACRVWQPIKTAEIGGGLIVLDDDQLDIFDALAEEA